MQAGYIECKRHKAFEELSKLFVPGTIFLPSAKAQDGDRLTITLESRGAGAEPEQGVTARFEVAVKKYGVKRVLEDSFLFLRRLGLQASATELGPKEVNFAPAPGVTFGVSFHKRGEQRGDKFLRALSPGIGVNVSFMNFDDPAFDLAANKFVNTTGTNIDVGAGIVAMLFDNNIQFVYGWNLNATQKRRYFGVGFSFVKIATTVAKFVK